MKHIPLKLKKSVLLLASLGVSLSLAACGSGQSSAMNDDPLNTSSSSASSQPSTSVSPGTGDAHSGKPDQSAQPGSSDPSSSESSPADPGTSQPAPADPGTSKPAPSEPGESKPSPADPGTAQPAPAQPVQPEPPGDGASKPAPSDPGASKPAPADPGESKPAPADPAKPTPGDGMPAVKPEAPTTPPKNPPVPGDGMPAVKPEAPTTPPKLPPGKPPVPGDSMPAVKPEAPTTPPKNPPVNPPHHNANPFAFQGGQPSVTCPETAATQAKVVTACLNQANLTVDGVSSEIAKALKSAAKDGVVRIYVQQPVTDTSQITAVQDTDDDQEQHVYFMKDVTVNQLSVLSVTDVHLMGNQVNGTIGILSGATLEGSGTVSNGVVNGGTLKLHQIYEADTALNAETGTGTAKTLVASDAIKAGPTNNLVIQHNGIGLVVKGFYEQQASGTLDLRAPEGQLPVTLVVDGPATLDGVLKVQTPAEPKQGRWLSAVITTQGFVNNFQSLGISDKNYPDLDLQAHAPQKEQFTYEGKTYYTVIYHSDPTHNLSGTTQKTVPVQDAMQFPQCDQVASFGWACDQQATTAEDVSQTLKAGDKDLYAFIKPVSIASDVTLKAFNGDENVATGSTLSFLGGLKAEQHTVTVDFGELLLPHVTYQANLLLKSHGSLVADGVVDGNVSVLDKGQLTVRSDFSSTDFMPVFVQSMVSPTHNRTYWIGGNLEQTPFLQYPVGLVVNALTLGANSQTDLEQASVYVKTSLDIQAGASVSVSYPSQALPYWGVVFVADQAATIVLHSDQFTQKIDGQVLKLAMRTGKQKDGTQLVLVKVPAKPAAVPSPSVHSARSVLRSSNVDTVIQQALPRMTSLEVTQANGRTQVLPIAMPTVLSRYATLLQSGSSAAQALQGTEFTQALDQSARSRVFLSNDNFFETLHHQGLRAPQLSADGLYLQLHADGHADREQLSLTAPVPNGLVRVALSRVGSTFNASYDAPNKGQAYGKDAEPSRSTTYSVNATVLQGLDGVLDGAFVSAEAAYQQADLQLMRPYVNAQQHPKDDYAIRSTSVGLSLGQRLNVAPQVVLTPFAGYRFAYDLQDKVTEALSVPGVNLSLEKQHFVRNSLVAGTSLRWAAAQGDLQGLSTEADLALAYRLNAPKDYQAQVQGGGQSIAISFKDSHALSTQLKLGVNYQYGDLNAGLSTQFYYAGGMDYGFGAHMDYRF